MKTQHTQTTVHDLGQKLELTHVRINGKRYALTIENYREIVSLNFSEGDDCPEEGRAEFTVIIREGNLSFHRHCYRPGHDHDDSEYCQTDPDGKIFWDSQGPWRFPDRKNRLFTIPFGPASPPEPEKIAP